MRHYKLLRNLGYEVKICTVNRPVQFTIGNIIVIDLSDQNLGDILRGITDGFDLIILNDQIATFFAGKYLSTRTLERSKVVLHGSEPEQIYEAPSGKRVEIDFQLHHYRALLNAKRIIAVSHFMKKKFLKITNFLEFSEKIDIVYTYTPRDLFYYAKFEGIRKDLRVLSEELLLVYAGRIDPQKGLDTCAEIIAGLLAKEVPAKLIVIGTGYYEERFRETIRVMGLSKNILFLGSRSQEEIRGYFCESDFLLMLSNYREAFSLVSTEAQSCGLPVITYDDSGTRESIIDGVTGKAFQRSNATGEIVDFLSSLDDDRTLDRFKKEEIASISMRFNSIDNVITLLA